MLRKKERELRTQVFAELSGETMKVVERQRGSGAFTSSERNSDECILNVKVKVKVSQLCLTLPPHSKYSQEVSTGRSSLRVGNKDVVVVSAYNVGDLGSIPGSGRSPGEGNGNPLQYSCLENPINGGSL